MERRQRWHTKALIFDLMGTCLDWHSSITPVLKQAITPAGDNDIDQTTLEQHASKLALDWRQGFFDEIHTRFRAGEPQEDIDVTHRRVLIQLLGSDRWKEYASMEQEDVEICVAAWHDQKAWPDILTALPELRQKYDVIVLANGTMRLQIDITKSSGLDFDMLLSSEVLSLTKPDPNIYHKALTLLNRRPYECIMVAAHAYDLRAARQVGMRTAYLHRWTEDTNEDMRNVEAESDIFVDCREARDKAGGLHELLRRLE